MLPVEAEIVLVGAGLIAQEELAFGTVDLPLVELLLHLLLALAVVGGELEAIALRHHFQLGIGLRTSPVLDVQPSHLLLELL